MSIYIKKNLFKKYIKRFILSHFIYMSLNTILRQKQIREMLDYDLVQNKRVFDNEIKHVESMNEAEAPPRKSDIEFEAEVRSNVDNIVLQLQRLMNAFDDIRQIVEIRASPLTRDILARAREQEEGPIMVDRGVGPGDEGGSKHLKGGIRGLSEEAFKLEAEKNASESISGIYSSFNSLVEKINSKLKFGYSSQGTNNIISLLQPIADGAKEVLSSAYKIKRTDSSIYNKIYSLLIEMINIIKEAPPLRRLDVTRIRDDHYQGDYDEPEANPDTRKLVANEYEDISTIESVIPRIMNTIRDSQEEINALQELLDENPDNDEIRDLIETHMQIISDARKSLAEAEIGKDASFKYSQYLKQITAIQSNIQQSEEILKKLSEKKGELLAEKREIETTALGARKQNLLSGVNKKLERLDSQISKTKVALDKYSKTLKDLESMEIKDRSDEVDEIGEIAQLPQQPAPEKPGKPVRKGAEKEARAIREEERALRQAEIAQGLPAGFIERMGPGVARTDEEAEVDRLMAEMDAGLLRQGFGRNAKHSKLGSSNPGKRRGRPSKKGGAKAMTLDDIHRIVVERNKAFAANNEATQLPRAPMTYLGLKADNSRGTLGAGKKKDIVMKQKDFVKEHKKLVSLLGKTANSLKSEAVEQTDELGKFDPETAKMLEKVVDKEKMKAGKKGKKSTKQLPTLVFDDKKNDWFI